MNSHLDFPSEFSKFWAINILTGSHHDPLPADFAESETSQNHFQLCTKDKLFQNITTIKEISSI
jgi:hypothetical protein